MKNLLHDLLNDLRAKRLWPVAVALLAGLVATPVVLSKKAEEPAPAPAPAEAAKAKTQDPEGPAALAEVKLEEIAAGSGSSLSSFDPSNPFAPPRKVLEAARDEVTAAAGGSDPAGGGGDASGGADAKIEGGSLGGGGGSGSGGSAPSGDTGSGTSTGGDTGSGGGTGGGGNTGTGGDTSGGADGETVTTQYTYVVDATFRANDRRRTIKGMEKLDILPHAAAPLLIFLGVTDKAGNAVFLVDSTLEAAGEGTCKPTGAECAFLYLGPGSEHEFTNEAGDSYTLRVDEIRRVKVGAKAKAGAARRKAPKAARAASARPASVRRFVPPFIADLTTTTTVDRG
jgi:hypothetical protein